MTPQSGARTAPESPPARFSHVRLPCGLRDDVGAMSWAMFIATYSQNSGPLRLGTWECGDDRPATRLGPQPCTFRASFAIGDRIETATAAASGPVAALTAMLYDRGIGLEVVGFHQLESDGHTATFVKGTDGQRATWAVGWSEDSTESALRAVIACANRLMAAVAR